jgi:multiple sugar transport system permease protein
MTRRTWTAWSALSTFLTAQAVNLPGLFAGAVVVRIVVLFLVAPRHIAAGVATSGLKQP